MVNSSTSYGTSSGGRMAKIDENETSPFLQIDTTNGSDNNTRTASKTSYINDSFFNNRCGLLCSMMLFVFIGGILMGSSGTWWIAVRGKNSNNKSINSIPIVILDKPGGYEVEKGLSSVGKKTSLSSTTNTTNNTNNEQQHQQRQRIRPVCTYYYNNNNHDDVANDVHEPNQRVTPPKIIQTSMEEPSQPWSVRECYPSLYPAHINSFDSPDAVLQVNFLLEDDDDDNNTVTSDDSNNNNNNNNRSNSSGDSNATNSTSTTMKKKIPKKKERKQEEEEVQVYESNSQQQQQQQKVRNQKKVPILGFGGAFTEAAALNFMTLSSTGQETVLELLFGQTGLGYNIGRFHINSCDFSIQSYSFDDHIDDIELQYFDTNVTHDVQSGMIEFAVRAQQVYDAAWGNTDNDENASRNNNSANQTLASKTDDDDDEETNYEVFRFFASPWSPPHWMKAPTWEDTINVTANSTDIPKYAQKMTFSAQPVCLRDGVRNESKYAAAWAMYVSKFISAYENHGIQMWAVTVQNEPEFNAPWEACSYSAQNESEYIYYHLGPILYRDHPTVKILAFDHNKDHVNVWVNTIHNTTKAQLEHYSSAYQYVDGTAYHWYAGGMDRLLDGAVGTPNLHRLQETIQNVFEQNNRHNNNKNDTTDRQKKSNNIKRTKSAAQHIVLGSEACHCPTTGYAGGDISNYWFRAERYAHTILADLATGSNGWLEWNLLLDSIGGPNHLHNLCDAPILAIPHRAIVTNQTTTTATTIIHPLPSFEKTKPMSTNGKTVIGDDRTVEELNGYGFNAKYIVNAGLAVQPLYYYTGHITRYVRPGSYSVPGLVNSPLIMMNVMKNKTKQEQPKNKRIGKIFQPLDTIVAGGGINDLARNGIEITVWPCEGSTRQQFVWESKDVHNTLYKRIQVHGHDWLGNPTVSCFGRMNDIDLFGITLTDCTNKVAGIYDIVQVENDTFNRYYIKLLNPIPTSSSNQEKGEENVQEQLQCLIILELANNGGSYGPRGGAQVAIGTCSTESAKWKLDIDNGIASSLYFVPSSVQLDDTTNSDGNDNDGNDDMSMMTSTDYTITDDDVVDVHDNNTTMNSSINSMMMISSYEVCMTTGWPFLQMGAFMKTTKITTNKKSSSTNSTTTSNTKTVFREEEEEEDDDDYYDEKEEDNDIIVQKKVDKTVIVLNEGRESANYVLKDMDTIVLTGSIPPRSIQTILL